MRLSTAATPIHTAETESNYRTSCDNLAKQDVYDFIAAVKADSGWVLEFDEAKQTANDLIELAKLVNKYQE